MARILIVDDDPKIRTVARLYLTEAGYETVEAGDGAAALALIQGAAPDLIVLDWMLPKLDGIRLLERLRADSDLPVLILTARVAVEDRLTGLERGADDYLTKPFHPAELVARVKALLRRTGRAGRPASIPLTVGLLQIDPARHEVLLDGVPVPILTAIEFRILQSLMEASGQVFTREMLLDQVYAWGEKYVLERTIDAHVAKIRAKLREAAPHLEPIQTVRGVGYRLEAGL